jgi:hypothetical protein
MNNKINNNNIIYNYQEEIIAITKAIVLFKNIFHPIILLEYNDKLGIINTPIITISEKYFNTEKINFKFYLDKYKFGQAIVRWIKSQNRFDIFECLDKLFYEYNEFLLRIMFLHNTNKNSFVLIINEIIIFNELLIEKLNILETTYSHMVVLNHILLYIEYLQNFSNRLNKPLV